jgi:hypothetical protein
MNEIKLKRRLERLSKQRDELLSKHKGKETSTYNYYAGWELGFLQGKIDILEDVLEDIKETQETKI